MADLEPVETTNLDRYGFPPLPWSRARPPPWPLYRFTFHTAFGVATAEPYGATRWRFDRWLSTRTGSRGAVS